MRKFFIFILIAITTLTGLNSIAQTDSTSNLSKPDSATKVNNGKEILLDTLTPKKDNATKTLAKQAVLNSTIQNGKVIPLTSRMRCPTMTKARV